MRLLTLVPRMLRTTSAWRVVTPCIHRSAHGCRAAALRRAESGATKDYQSGERLLAQLAEALERKVPGVCAATARPVMVALMGAGVKPGKVVGVLASEPALAAASVTTVEPALRWLKSVPLASSEESWREQCTAPEKVALVVTGTPAILLQAPAQLDAVTDWLLVQQVRTRAVGRLLERCPRLWSEPSIELMERRRRWLLDAAGVDAARLAFVISECPECLTQRSEKSAADADAESRGVSDDELDAALAWLRDECGIAPARLGATVVAMPKVLRAGAASPMQRALLRRVVAVKGPRPASGSEPK